MSLPPTTINCVKSLRKWYVTSPPSLSMTVLRNPICACNHHVMLRMYTQVRNISPLLFLPALSFFPPLLPQCSINMGRGDIVSHLWLGTQNLSTLTRTSLSFWNPHWPLTEASYSWQAGRLQVTATYTLVPTALGRVAASCNCDLQT